MKLYRVTTVFMGADKAAKLYYKAMDKAQAFLDGCDNGRIDQVDVVADYPLNYSDGCTMNDLTFGDFNAKEAELPEGGIVGKFPGSDLDIVNIGGRLYVLDGWNGEKWTDCRECADRWNIDPSGTVYEIAPVYDWDLYDEDAGAFIDADGKIVDGLVDYMLL